MGDRQGFTLIELMVVVAIVGILLAIALPSYTRWQERETLREAVMRVKASLGEARSRSVQKGLYWGQSNYDGANCSRLRFGVAFNTSTMTQQYYCETSGDQTMDSGEIRDIRTLDFSAKTTGLDVGISVATSLKNDRVFFRKDGTTAGSNQGTVTLSVGGQSQGITVIRTGRLGE